MIPWRQHFSEDVDVFVDSAVLKSGERSYRAKLMIPHRKLSQVTKIVAQYGITDVQCVFTSRPMSRKTYEAIRVYKRVPKTLARPYKPVQDVNAEQAAA